MSNEISHDDIDRQYHLLRTEPEKFLELTNRLVAQLPSDAGAYFVRHQALSRLGQFHLALADIDKALALEENDTRHMERGRILHHLGRYRDAIAAYDRAAELDPEQWKGGFGPLFRADAYARLGDELAALADCATLPDDHWTPGLFDAPAGNKDEVAAELRRRAAAAGGKD